MTDVALRSYKQRINKASRETRRSQVATNIVNSCADERIPEKRQLTIDFVLTYRKQKENEHRRRFFNQNMIAEGFHLEFKEIQYQKEQHVIVLIHVPDEVILRYAEIWRVKLPVLLESYFLPSHETKEPMEQLYSVIHAHVLFNDNWHFSDRNNHFLWPYLSEHSERYVANSKSSCLREAQRQAIVWNIMQTLPNDPKDSKRRGIELLLKIRVYDHAYPVHDGDVSSARIEEGSGPISKRQLLRLSENEIPHPLVACRQTWASHRCTFHKQPLHLVYRYFGHKVGFYFAFMGFYTRMLIPAAVAGVMVTLFGLLNMNKDDVAMDVCDPHSSPGNLTMCPICEPPNCEVWKFAVEGCSRTKLSYVMNNEATLFMSCFIIVWEVIFLKFWKRTEASLAFEWGTDDLQHCDEIIRPDYIAKATTKRLDKVTMEFEDYIPWQIRVSYFTLSLCVTLFMLISAGVVLVGLSMLRVILYGEYRKIGGIFQHHSIEFARWTIHGFIFLAVLIYDKVYNLICHRLTTMERPKTEKQYWFSFLWKLFVFELLNEFTPIFYVAFFKEVSVDTPLDLTFPKELCDPGGCTSEVTELISILLLARLVLSNMLGTGMEWMNRLLDKCWLIYSRKSSHYVDYPQWRKDLNLEKLEYDGVVVEFMEMIIQFAFCTVFIASFPLAPLVCLINNLIEVRRDAKKMINHRRPVPVRVSGIGIWNTFFEWVVQISVLTNAALLSFTSDIIPKLYYKSVYSKEHNFLGFAEFSLSRVFTKNWVKLSKDYENITECWYKGYRHSYPPYSLKSRFWEMLAVRIFGFTVLVCIFYSITFVISRAISDRPAWVQTRISRTKYLAGKVLL
ncbi:Anoctamin [Trichuris trichiura]|uniref:Anoctamin n=1 Tax=Trichuris trichiura TaxID=36087 RepID=A0A077ZAE1_TRITR|nr:Anoctamin [Trichuris trichiura]